MLSNAHIVGSFTQLWNMSVLPSLVPGGLYDWRAATKADAQTRPYGIIKVENIRHQYCVGIQAIVYYRVEISVWASQYLAQSDQIQQALENLYNWSNQILNCKEVMPIKQNETVDKQLSQRGKDIHITTCVWQACYEETR